MPWGAEGEAAAAPAAAAVVASEGRAPGQLLRPRSRPHAGAECGLSKGAGAALTTNLACCPVRGCGTADLPARTRHSGRNTSSASSTGKSEGIAWRDRGGGSPEGVWGGGGQVGGDRVVDLSRGMAAAAPGWAALRVLAPPADVRLLLAAAPTASDSASLACAPPLHCPPLH